MQVWTNIFADSDGGLDLEKRLDELVADLQEAEKLLSKEKVPVQSQIEKTRAALMHLVSCYSSHIHAVQHNR